MTVVEVHASAVAHVPGVRVLAVQAAQRAAGEEQHEPGARAVDAGGDVPGVNRGLPGVVARSPGSHIALWKVREMTSRCCSGVSRTKLTA